VFWAVFSQAQRRRTVVEARFFRFAEAVILPVDKRLPHPSPKTLNLRPNAWVKGDLGKQVIGQKVIP